jgi:hypothetical protein
MTTYLRYYDERFGDVYEIYLNKFTGEFESACRSVEALGRDPIYYYDFDEIPVAHRGPIEQMIVERKKQKDGNGK